MKYSKLYGFIPLGVALISIVLLEMGTYERPLSVALQNHSILYAFVWLFSAIGGTAFLIIGILGIEWQYLKNRSELFYIFLILTVVSIPILIIALIKYVTVFTPMYA